MPQFPGKSAFAGLFTCPECGKTNHFSYHYLKDIDSLETQRRCSSCGKSSELRAYKVRARSFPPKV